MDHAERGGDLGRIAIEAANADLHPHLVRGTRASNAVADDPVPADIFGAHRNPIVPWCSRIPQVERQQDAGAGEARLSRHRAYGVVVDVVVGAGVVVGEGPAYVEHAEAYADPSARGRHIDAVQHVVGDLPTAAAPVGDPLHRIVDGHSVDHPIVHSPGKDTKVEDPCGDAVHREVAYLGPVRGVVEPEGRGEGRANSIRHAGGDNRAAASLSDQVHVLRQDGAGVRARSHVDRAAVVHHVDASLYRRIGADRAPRPVLRGAIVGIIPRERVDVDGGSRGGGALRNQRPGHSQAHRQAENHAQHLQSHRFGPGIISPLNGSMSMPGRFKPRTEALTACPVWRWPLPAGASGSCRRRS